MALVVLSLNFPVAENCLVPPISSVVVSGVRMTRTRTGGGLVTVTDEVPGAKVAKPLRGWKSEPADAVPETV